MVPLKQITEAQTSEQLNSESNETVSMFCSIKSLSTSCHFFNSIFDSLSMDAYSLLPSFLSEPHVLFPLTLPHWPIFFIFFLCIVFFLVYNYLVSTNSDSKLEIKFIPNLCPVYFLLHTPSLPDNIYFLSFEEGVFMTVV